MGLTGTGTAVKFIPRPVVVGFTNGIALLIASTQIKDFFGITVPGAVPGEFVGRARDARPSRRHHVVRPRPRVGIGVVVLILVWNRLVPRVPGYIVALVAGTAVVAAGRPAGRDDRHAVRRHPHRPARRPLPEIPARPRS